MALHILWPNKIQYSATINHKNPKDKDKISNKVKIGKKAHAMTYVNPQTRVRSGAQEVGISYWLAIPITHTVKCYARVKQTC